MTTRSPGSGDRHGVRQRSTRAHDTLRDVFRVGLYLATRLRGQEHPVYVFGAHTPETLARLDERQPPPPPYRPPRVTAHDVTMVHVTCRCGARDVPIYAHLAATGYLPRCGRLECERLDRNGEPIKKGTKK